MRQRSVRLGWNAAFVVGGALACRELRKRGQPEKAKWASRIIFAVSVGLAVNAAARAR